MAFDPDVFTIYNEEITYSNEWDAYSLNYAPVGEIVEVYGEVNGASITFDVNDYILAGIPFPCEIVWVGDTVPDQGSNFTVTYTYEPTFDSIQQYMLQTLQLARPDINIANGSAAYNILGATAQSIADLYHITRYIQRAAYINTAESGFLDEVALLLGATRNPAVPAGGVVQLQASIPVTDSGTIPKGFQVGTQYRTGSKSATYSCVADTDYNEGDLTCNISVTADVAGSGGNMGADKIVRIIDYTADFAYCTNPSPMLGGLDGETDDAFRARAKHQRQLLGKCTRDSLQYLCESVPGIKQAIVQDKNTNGEFDSGNAVITLIGEMPLTDDSNPSVAASWAYAAAKSLCLDPSNCPAGTQLIIQVPFYFTLDFYLSLVLSSAVGVTQSYLIDQLENELTTYINSLTMGTPLYHQQLLAHILTVDNIDSVNSMTVLMHVTDENIQFDGVNPDHLLYPSNTTNTNVIKIMGTVTIDGVTSHTHVFAQNTDYIVAQRLYEGHYYLDINWQSTAGAVNPDMDTFYYIEYTVENTNDPIVPIAKQIFTMGTVTLE